MKKSILTAAILAASASVAQADIIGAKLGYNYWNTANHGDFQTVYGQIEHPIPLLPNLAVGYSKLNHDKLKFDSYDASGYYEILDNGNIALDLGLGARRFDSGKYRDASFSDTVPMLTADVELFQASSLSFYSKLYVGKSSDTSFNDFEVGARFHLFAGLNLQGGYRTYEIEMDGTKGIYNDERIKGFNLGLHWDI
ncbi:TIGR04219 family outer membrane beta-barrel protein [Endozoicomonas arenosclerae]|uniref:TIGR04219 family outer membrane beta-barrel protein n=1 Tax=Endozoicomonas arenosclerae TaxID=1633495 RepID=UPI00078040FB|nr:TIGR04219 family outer membrane beta-barrel protein [Endozoicomonas arenosclerae]